MITRIRFVHKLEFGSWVAEVNKKYIQFYQTLGHDCITEPEFYTKNEFESYVFQDKRLPTKLINNIFKAIKYLNG